MRVRPVVKGAVIRDPQTKQPLSQEGGEVPENSFWHRRLLAGEVVLVVEQFTGSRELAPVTPLTTRGED